MKKFIYILTLSVIVFASCSEPSNEKKARKLIEPVIKANLVEPQSYKFKSIQLDSCFSDDMNRNPKCMKFNFEISKLYEEYKEHMKDAESAESSMTIYAPSYGYQSAHSKFEYDKYKKAMELANRKAEAKKDKILNLYKQNKDLFINVVNKKHEFIGWMVQFSYDANSMIGLERSTYDIVYIDKDFTQILSAYTESEIRSLSNYDEDFQYEFTKDIEKVLTENE